MHSALSVSGYACSRLGSLALAYKFENPRIAGNIARSVCGTSEMAYVRLSLMTI